MSLMKGLFASLSISRDPQPCKNKRGSSPMVNPFCRTLYNTLHPARRYLWSETNPVRQDTLKCNIEQLLRSGLQVAFPKCVRQTGPVALRLALCSAVVSCLAGSLISAAWKDVFAIGTTSPITIIASYCIGIENISRIHAFISAVPGKKYQSFFKVW